MNATFSEQLSVCSAVAAFKPSTKPYILIGGPFHFERCGSSRNENVNLKLGCWNGCSIAQRAGSHEHDSLFWFGTFVQPIDLNGFERPSLWGLRVSWCAYFSRKSAKRTDRVAWRTFRIKGCELLMIWWVFVIVCANVSCESPSSQASHVRAIVPLQTVYNMWAAQVTCQLMCHNWISMCKAHYSPLSIRSLHDRCTAEEAAKETAERNCRKKTTERNSHNCSPAR